MSYTALARKWRPKKFSELTGQEHVRRALVNALESGRVHHAFLFTGTRGVGKTTIARILAKCLNCETGVRAEPCGVCASCLEIDAGRFPDLIEVDAASRTEVDAAGLKLVAQAADGSMRDALSLLDQLIAFGGGRAGEAEARAMLGTISRDHVLRIAQLLAEADGAALVSCARSLEEFAPDYAQVLDELAALLVRVGLRQAVSDYEGDELYAPELLERLARALSPEDVQLFYQTAIIGRRDLPLAPDPRTGFEMTLLRMIAFRPAGESGVTRTPAAEPAARAAASAAGAGSPSAASGPAGASSPVEAAGAADPWASIVNALELSGAARQLASHCVFLGRQGALVRLGID